MVNLKKLSYKKLTSLVMMGIMSLGVSSTALAAETVELNLADSIGRALAQNSSIVQSAASQEAAKWALSKARRVMGPAVAWTGVGRANGEDYKTQYGDKTLSSAFSLDMPLYNKTYFGNIDSSRYSLNSADLTLENTKQTIKYNATSYYYNILQSRNMVDVYNEQVQTLQAHLDNVNSQFRVGTVAKSDVLNSEVRLANAKQSLISAQNSYNVAVSTLNNLIGLPSDTNLVITDQLKYTPYELSLDDCIEYALLHRPDGASYDYAVKTAEAQVDAAKGGYYPTLDAIGLRTDAGQELSSMDDSKYWYGGLQIGWNIFDNGQTAASVNSAKANLKAAQSQAAQSKEDIRLDVRQAYLNLKAAEENIQTMSKAVEQAQEDYRIAEVRYRAGIGTNLSAMDARSTLTTALTNYYQALYNYNVYKAALDKAMGIPVDLDTYAYVLAEQEGLSSAKAIEKATIDPVVRDKAIADETFASTETYNGLVNGNAVKNKQNTKPKTVEAPAAASATDNAKTDTKADNAAESGTETASNTQNSQDVATEISK